DRALYVAMTGATQMMRSQAEVAHNLANADTVGFKAQMSAFQPLPVEGPGLATRVNGVAWGLGVDQRSGAMIQTGRNLDVAVQGGTPVDARGNQVMGEGGPLILPRSTQVAIGNDGTVSVVPQGQGPETIAVVGRLKLVNPAAGELTLGTDGLMHTAGNVPA